MRHGLRGVLAEAITESIGYEVVPVAYEDGTIEVETNAFFLECWLCDPNLIVKEIHVKTAEQDQGLAREVVGALCRVCRRHRLVPAAENVQPEAVGFWTRIGFAPAYPGSDFFEFCN